MRLRFRPRRALISRDRFSTRARNGTSFPSRLSLSLASSFTFSASRPRKSSRQPDGNRRDFYPHLFIAPSCKSRRCEKSSLVIAFSRPSRILGTSSQDQRGSTLSFHHFESRDFATPCLDAFRGLTDRPTDSHKFSSHKDQIRKRETERERRTSYYPVYRKDRRRLFANYLLRKLSNSRRDRERKRERNRERGKIVLSGSM